MKNPRSAKMDPNEPEPLEPSAPGSVRPWPLRYGVALLCVLIAFLLRYAAIPFTAHRAVFLLFIPAVMIASWFGGVGPGLLASFIGLVLANYFLFPLDQWNPLDPEQLAAAAIYLFATLVVVGLSFRIRREQNKVATRAEALRQEIERRKVAERELLEREQRLRLIFNNARGVAIISMDQEGRIEEWSEGAQEIFGYAPNEIVGQHTRALFAPEEQAKGVPDEELQKAREAGCGTDERWHVGKSGKRIYASEVACAKYDENGTFIGYLKVAINLTESALAKEALAKSQERFRAIYESAAVGITQVDEHGRFLGINRRFCEITGYSEQELLQRAFYDITIPDDREFDAEQYAHLRSGQIPLFRREKRYRRKDGEIIWVRVTASYLAERSMAIAVVEDINKEKHALEQLRDSEERLRVTAELTQIGMWEWDVEKDTVTGNPYVKKHLGLPQESHVSLRSFVPLVHPHDRERISQLINECVRTQSSYDGECRVIWPDGSEHWIWLKGSPINSPSGLKFVGVVTEITDRKQAEAELQQARNILAHHAEELEQQVQERTAQLQESLGEMEEFCYAIAPDLRAPLRAMRGFSSALQEDYASSLDRTAKLYCEKIAGASDRMDQLINDLLAYGRLTHAEITPQAVDLGEELEKVLARTDEQIQMRRAIVSVDQPLPKVCAYPAVLDQVLENLVSNAIKFVPPNRQPHIHIYAEHHEDHVRICVDDNGIGIQREHHRRIFDPFQRLHREEEFPGTGIGLAIVQKGIEKMGGQVGVESEPGRGSRFWIDLPDDSKCEVMGR
ncbi:MAG: PAS domain S-box protein [Limisphaerales bacterium]